MCYREESLALPSLAVVGDTGRQQHPKQRYLKSEVPLHQSNPQDPAAQGQKLPSSLVKTEASGETSNQQR